MAARYEIQGNVQGLLDAAALGAPGTNILTARSASVAVTGLPGMYAALTAVTGTAVDDTFTKTAHGLANGNVVGISALTGGAGLSDRDTRLYFVINTAANTFQLSDAPAGTPVNFTSDVTTATVQRSPDLTLFTTEVGSTTTANPLTADGATGKINAWIKAPDYDMTISGTGISTTTVRVRQSASGSFNVFAYGAVGDGTTDDTAAVQATVAAASLVPDAPVHVPYGTYKMTATLTLPTLSNGMLISGEGTGASVLSWAATDLGTGQYAIKWPDGAGAQEIFKITDMKLLGPSGGFVPGTSPANMDGIRLSPSCNLIDCKVYGFRAGVVIYGDHQIIEGCKISNNFDAVYWGASPPSRGNQTLRSCRLDGNTRSSVCVSPSNNIDACVWDDVHLGFAPYGIYFEDGTITIESAINSSILINIGFEECGNGYIYDASWTTGTRSVNSTTFLNPTGGNLSVDPDYVWVANASDYAVQIAQVAGLHIVGGSGFGTFGDLGAFRGATWNNFTWRPGYDQIRASINYEVANPPNRTFTMSSIQNAVLEGEGTIYRVCSNNGGTTINPKELVEQSSAGQVVSQSGANGLAGIAMNTAATGGECIVAVSGRVAAVKTDGAAVSAGEYLSFGASAATVRTWPGTVGSVIIGWATANNSGSTVDAMITVGGQG